MLGAVLPGRTGSFNCLILDYRDDFLAAFTGAGAFFAEETFALPMTVIDPDAGTIVDSAPVDHLTREGAVQ